MRNSTLHVLFGFFAALFAASQANIIAELGPVFDDLLRLQTTFSDQYFQDTISGWSAEEMARYRSHFAWDSVHPLVYGGFLILWTLVVHRRRAFAPTVLRLTLIAAVVPAVLDYVENAFHIYLSVNPEAINPVTVTLAGTAATLKWTIAGLVVLTLLIASVRAVMSGSTKSVVTGRHGGRDGDEAADASGRVSALGDDASTPSDLVSEPGLGGEWEEPGADSDGAAKPDANEPDANEPDTSEPDTSEPDTAKTDKKKATAGRAKR